MRTIYTLFIALFLSTVILWGKTGLNQSHMVSISPDPDSSEVVPTVSFAFTFDRPINKDSIDQSTVHLQHNQQKIKGNVSIREDNTLLFSPAQPLQKGAYEINVTPLKLLKEDRPEVKPANTLQEIIFWLCSLLYDDVSECPLCSFACDLDDTITTQPVRYTFEVKEDAPKIISLSADKMLLELTEHNTTQITLTAIYDNNTSEDVTAKADYESSDTSVAEVESGRIDTFNEGSASIHITYLDKSLDISVEVYEMIEGHLLPHEPENPGATLLGVDKNSNGVRDEVERWIYREMPTYHHPEIERVIAMQQAKAYQMALVDPTNTDDKVLNALTRGSDCWAYYSYSKDIPFDGAVEKFDNSLKDIVFNTKERLKTYYEYDYSLKGRVFFSTPLRLLNTSYCDKNIDEMP